MSPIDDKDVEKIHYVKVRHQPRRPSRCDWIVGEILHARFRPAASRASVSMPRQSPAASIAPGATHEPPTQTTFDSARYSGAVARVMPPVRQKNTSGNAAPR